MKNASKVTLWVALIGAAGLIGAAIISSRSKLSDSSNVVSNRSVVTDGATRAGDGGNITLGPGTYAAGPASAPIIITGGKGGDVNNVLAVTQSVSVGSIQVNNGISEAMMRELLRNAMVAQHKELASRYPSKFVLLGVASGKILYEDKSFGDFEAEADWEEIKISIDQPGWVTLSVPEIRIRDSRLGVVRGTYSNYREMQPLKEGHPMPSLMVTGMYWEVLDAAKLIFVIGFK